MPFARKIRKLQATDRKFWVTIPVRRSGPSIWKKLLENATMKRDAHSKLTQIITFTSTHSTNYRHYTITTLWSTFRHKIRYFNWVLTTKFRRLKNFWTRTRTPRHLHKISSLVVSPALPQTCFSYPLCHTHSSYSKEQLKLDVGAFFKNTYLIWFCIKTFLSLIKKN